MKLIKHKNSHGTKGHIADDKGLPLCAITEVHPENYVTVESNSDICCTCKNKCLRERNAYDSTRKEVNKINEKIGEAKKQVRR